MDRRTSSASACSRHERGEFRSTGSILYGPGGHADDGRHRIDILGNDRTGPHDGLKANANILNDRCADPDESAALYRNVSSQPHARTNMRRNTNHRFMVDNAPGIQDGVVTDLAMRADQRSSSNHNALAQRRIVSQLRGWMNRAKNLKIGRFQ